VRSNLLSALKHLRSKTRDLWFWIDAVCINQQDNFEKASQLAQLLSIYSKAFNVCIWLGPDDGEGLGYRALHFIANIINLKFLDQTVKVNHLGEVAARSWFQRRWVLQEVAASRAASVQCGNHSVNWVDFADAVQLLMAKIDHIRAAYSSSTLFKQDPDALTHVESTGANVIVDMTNNVLHKGRGGLILDRLWTIETLVMASVAFDVSDPRDTIYALLPLA
ncbi:hypothetical protein EJ04DRAFT_394066, partial [Polyplosphaeria fusca]